jgi:amino-acid N-acetyltransferase
MSDAIRIRPAEASDLAGVTTLLAEAKLVPLGSDSQFGPQYAVATRGDLVIGVAGLELHGDDGILRSVCLHPQYRSLRIGAALVEDRVGWARDRGLRGLYLLTATASDYWPRFGFKQIDRAAVPEEVAKSSQWSGACPSDSTAMLLKL